MEFSAFLLSAFFIGAALGAYTGAINDNRLRWQDARQECLDRRPSCDLSVQGTELGDFWDPVQRLDIGSHYWIGARKKDLLKWNDGGTTLIESQGCYEAPVWLNSTVGALWDNGPKRCLSQCDGNYAALENKICHCINSMEMMSFRQRPLEECHVYCTTEPYRCGGGGRRVSVYKIPERTLLQVVGNRKNFFWRRTFTNEQELVVFTNKPRAKQGRMCVSSSGKYSTAGQGAKCPRGTRPLTFENGKVMDILNATSSVTDMDMDYQSSLTFQRQFLWLNGERVTPAPAAGKGGCVSITHNGQGLSLAIRKCKDALPSVCACYTRTDKTEAPTTQTTSTTTELLSTQTTTSTTETSFVSSTTQEDTTSTATFTTATSASSSAPTTELTRELPSEENSTLLFPFHVMNESDVPLLMGPQPGQSLSNEDEDTDTASAALSTEVIVGICVGAVAIVVIVVVVAVAVKRRRTGASSSLLKEKDKGSKRSTSYPI